MAALSLCLFFAVTVVVQSEGYPFTKGEAVHLDNTIRAVVDDMLARQVSVYDARITKLETLNQQQNRKIRILETREKRQRITIQNLTSMVSELTSRQHFRHNERTLPSQIRDNKKGKATFESEAVEMKNSESLLYDLKPDGGRKTRGSSGLNFRAIAVSENVAFSAYLDHDVAHLSVGHTVKFNRVHLNDGNGYNTFTGVFTVSVSGVYLFTYHWNSHSRYTVLELLVDNVQQAAAIANPNSSHDTMGGQTIIVSVNAGQAVWIEDFWASDGEVISRSTFQYATFAGTLLY